VTTRRSLDVRSLAAQIDRLATKIGTRTEAARRAGITVQQLRRLIVGTSTPRVTTLLRLAEAAGERLDWAAIVRSRHVNPVPVLKECSCCATLYTCEEWQALALVGPMDDGAGGVLELRNCPCGTTMAVHTKVVA
jgi:hypothetical protein